MRYPLHREKGTVGPTKLADVTRGEIVESAHHGVVVAVDQSGHIVAQAGDPEHVAYFRSSAKPFQAIPVVESGAADAFGFTPSDLAFCCSSHNAEPAQQEAGAAMLAKIGLGAEALRCGIAAPYDEMEAARVKAGLVPPSQIQCDCSGKHTGMLATCVHLGWPTESYLEPEHPLQRRIRAIISEVLRLDEDHILLAADGCSVPTFGAPMRTFAMAYATFADPESAPSGHGREHASALLRLRAAMTAHPQNIAGHGELDTDLMEVTGGRVVAKLGAEGLLCLAVPERALGIAIRILDGSERARSVAALATLEQLEVLGSAEVHALRERQDPAITNFNGWRVGEVRPTFHLEVA
ncbi:MAG: asparaginase [Chloroflexota bacterium]|nr:asparaginase [Chloroflexota bacterium]